MTTSESLQPTPELATRDNMTISDVGLGAKPAVSDTDTDLGGEDAQAPTATAQAVVDAPTAEQPRIITMPETPEQLKFFVTAAINEMLANPANAATFASIAVNGFATALKNDQQRLDRDMNRPVLVKSYFQGAMRATTVVAEDEITGQQLSGVLELQSPAGSWYVAPFDDEKKNYFVQLLLARATVPGEVWFFTSSRALENAAAQGADLMMAANGL